MFRSFKPSEELGQGTLLKSSAVRAMRQSILDMYPAIEEYIDDILPKKEGISEVKGKDKMSFIMRENEPMFFKQRDGPFLPTLRLLHKYPIMMQRVQVDAGGVKFVMKGADCMCPGLTSAGGAIPVELPAGCPVAVYGQGKEHAMSIGILRMSTEDVRKVNKGAAVETMHHLGDELWQHPTF